MSSWRIAAVALITIGFLAVDAPVSAAASGEGREAVIASILRKAEPKLMEVVVTRVDDNGRPRFETINVPTLDKARAVVDQFLGAPGVEAVEMNRTVQTFRKCRNPNKVWSKKKKKCVRRPGAAAPSGGAFSGVINDPGLPLQWALDSSHLNVHALTGLTWADSRVPSVAVIDTGVNAGHPDLAGRVDAQVNFINSNGADECGHGTHVAGTIAANANNGIGVTGMSRTAVIRSVKVLGTTFETGPCDGTTSAVANGIAWAADRADVLNMSFGVDIDSQAVAAAINYAASRGRVLVAASGNHDSSCGLLQNCLPNTVTYPAAYSGVLGVAAVDPSGAVAEFSNFGYWVDVAAPGVGILSTTGSDYEYMDGTSMAAPHVSALAAMLIAHCGMSAPAVSDSIVRWASHSPTRDDRSGYGIIRPYESLQCR